MSLLNEVRHLLNRRLIPLGETIDEVFSRIQSQVTDHPKHSKWGDALNNLIAEARQLHDDELQDLFTSEELRVKWNVLRNRIFGLCRKIQPRDAQPVGRPSEESLMRTLNRDNTEYDFIDWFDERLCVGEQRPLVAVAYGCQTQGNSYLTERLLDGAYALRDSPFREEKNRLFIEFGGHEFRENSFHRDFENRMCDGFRTAIGLDHRPRKEDLADIVAERFRDSDKSLLAIAVDFDLNDRLSWADPLCDISMAPECIDRLGINAKEHTQLILLNIRYAKREAGFFGNLLNRIRGNPLERTLAQLNAWNKDPSQSPLGDQLCVLEELGDISHSHVEEWLNLETTRAYLDYYNYPSEIGPHEIRKLFFGNDRNVRSLSHDTFAENFDNWCRRFHADDAPAV